MESVQIGKDRFFTLPQLEVRLNASAAMPKLKDDLKHLDALPFGEQRRRKFTDFFQSVGRSLNVDIPGVALNPQLPIEGPGQKTGTDGLFIYWRHHPYGHAFFVIADLHNNRMGFWDTEKTGKWLAILF